MDLPPPGVGDTEEKSVGQLFRAWSFADCSAAEIWSVILVLLCMLVWIT